MKHPLQAPSTVALTLATAVAALLAALLLGLLAPAWADPMRPLVPPPVQPMAAAGGSPAQAPTAMGSPSGPAWPSLRALRQDSEGRHQALLGDQWVRVGDRLPSAEPAAAQPPTVVAAIDGQRVQLRQGRQTHTLHLLPPLRYSAAAASAPVSSPSGSQRAPGR